MILTETDATTSSVLLFCVDDGDYVTTIPYGLVCGYSDTDALLSVSGMWLLIPMNILINWIPVRSSIHLHGARHQGNCCNCCWFFYDSFLLHH